MATTPVCPPACERGGLPLSVLSLILLCQCSAWFESKAGDGALVSAPEPPQLVAPTVSPAPAPAGTFALAPPASTPLGRAAGVGSTTIASTSRTSEPVRPALDSELHRLRHLAQGRVLGLAPPLLPRALPYAPATAESLADGSESPSALGRFVPIENEAALQHFHTALARLAAGNDDDKKVRILAYGASHTQSDLYTGYLRTYLQSRFGDGGQGFVLLGRVNRWYRTLDTYATHQGLQVLHARYKRNVESEPLGLFGAAMVGKHADAYAEILTSKESTSTRFELQFLEQPGGGDFTVRVDGKAGTQVATRADRIRAGYHTFQISPGAHRISVRLAGTGPVRLFGIVGESDAPGVVVDTLGISGTRMTDQIRWRDDLWVEALKRRAPDLVTFAYGTNEVKDTKMSIQAYEAALRAVLARFRRALPEVSCVLISPFDLAASARPRLVAIIEAQRRISREFFCGFWDGYAFMGGEGSLRRWIHAKPPLASSDHIHLTRRGYVYAGIALGDALMRAYDVSQVQGLEPPRMASSPPPTP